MEDDTFTIEIAFFAFWFLLLIGSAAFFYGCKDAALKRRWYPRFGIFAILCFSAFASYTTGPAILGIVIPWCAFAYWVNTYTTKFCDDCGATLLNKYWWPKEARTRYSPNCGANLTDAALKRESAERQSG